jgi:hypothetical protein
LNNKIKILKESSDEFRVKRDNALEEKEKLNRDREAN